MPEEDGVVSIDCQRIKCLVEDDKKNIEARNFIERRCALANLLPLRQRAIFKMYYEMDMSFKEIGEVFNIFPENVSRRMDTINRVLDHLTSDVQGE